MTSAYVQAKPGLDPNGPSGMDTEQACATYTQGDPRVVVAYVEGGINWARAQGIVDNIYVNWREVPIPCVGDTVATAVMPTLGDIPCVPAWSPDPTYYAIPTADGSNVQDAPDGQPVVDASDWSHDPRVHDANHNGYIDPEDLIVAFSCFDPQYIGNGNAASDGVISGVPDDAAHVIGTPSWPGGTLTCSNGAAEVSIDGTGFPHDISGWDFYDNTNDPATPDAAYPHSDGEMGAVASYCPYCMIMPVKAGDEALDETDELAEAWLFAGDTGASVITSVTADLGYSHVMSEVIASLEHRGIVMVEASNDFDSDDHQGGMYWPGVVPGNSVEVNLANDGWTRSDTTSWGTHNLFDVANGGSTSTSTSDMGGLFGLLMSYGDEQLGYGQPTSAFTGLEAEQVVRQTATPIQSTSGPWPGAPGDWSEQYGYGIMNLYRAMGAIHARNLPPVAELTTPNWYSLEDPTHTSTVAVTAEVQGGKSAPLSWQLQYGIGAEPTAWHTFAQGNTTATGTGPSGWHGVSGTLDLSQIPKSFWTAPFTDSQQQTMPTADQYDVTLRIEVVDATTSATGTDRRTIDVVHDASWANGFPLVLGSSGVGQPALADLTGDGRLDIIAGTPDGTIDVIDPVTGKAPAGTAWATAHTDPTTVLGGWPSAAPWPLPTPRDKVDDAVLADVAVGDLEGNGALSVVATTESGMVYVFDATGHLEPGWPRNVTGAVPSIPVPRPALPFTRLPVPGAVAAPVLVALQPSHPTQLDIVQAAWSGQIHALLPTQSGSLTAPLAEVPGWPVTSQPPATTPSGYVLVDDHKLDATPTVAYFDGHNRPPTIVERTQYTYSRGSGIQPDAHDFVDAFTANGSVRKGWPVELLQFAEYYGSAQEFITEDTSSGQAADVTGTGVDDIEFATLFSPPVLLDGAGQVVSTYAAASPGLSQLLSPATLADPTAVQHLPDVPVFAGASGGAFGRLGGVLDFATPEVGALSLLATEEVENAGLPINNFESVFPALGGAPSPGFPASRQGLEFLGEPSIANVDSSGLGNVVEGGDSDWLGAYTLTGSDAPASPNGPPAGPSSDRPSATSMATVATRSSRRPVRAISSSGPPRAGPRRRGRGRAGSTTTTTRATYRPRWVRC